MKISTDWATQDRVDKITKVLEAGGKVLIQTTKDGDGVKVIKFDGKIIA